MKNRDSMRSFETQIGLGHQMAVPSVVFFLMSCLLVWCWLTSSDAVFAGAPTPLCLRGLCLRCGRRGKMEEAIFTWPTYTRSSLPKMSSTIDTTVKCDDAGTTGTCRHWPYGRTNKQKNRYKQKQPNGLEKENANVISRIWWKWSGN